MSSSATTTWCWPAGIATELRHIYIHSDAKQEQDRHNRLTEGITDELRARNENPKE